MRRVLLTLVCLAACKDKPAEPIAPPPQPPHDGVKLIQPGTAPYQTLRYHFTKGARTASTLVCDYAIKSDGQGDAIPPMIVELETVVDDVLGDGSAKLRFTITRAQPRDPAPDATPDAADALQADAVALQGAVITALLAPDGKTSGTKVEPTATADATGSAAHGAPAAAPDATASAAHGPPAPDKARAQLATLIESLEHAAAQLPVEPVGVGATWVERRTLPPGGITGVAEIVYTVTALTASSFAYTSAGQLTGGPQTIEREGVKIEVSNTSGHSEAKGTVELARYALDVDVSLVFSSTMNAIAPKDVPGSGSSKVEVTMATRMTPSPAPSAGSAGSADSTPSSPSPQGAHNAP